MLPEELEGASRDDPDDGEAGGQVVQEGDDSRERAGPGGIVDDGSQGPVEVREEGRASRVGSQPGQELGPPQARPHPEPEDPELPEEPEPLDPPEEPDVDDELEPELPDEPEPELDEPPVEEVVEVEEVEEVEVDESDEPDPDEPDPDEPVVDVVDDDPEPELPVPVDDDELAARLASAGPSTTTTSAPVVLGTGSPDDGRGWTALASSWRKVARDAAAWS